MSIPSEIRQAGDEIEVTPEMIEAGLEWLYAYSADATDGRDTVREIIRAALAILLLECRRGGDGLRSGGPC